MFDVKFTFTFFTKSKPCSHFSSVLYSAEALRNEASFSNNNNNKIII